MLGPGMNLITMVIGFGMSVTFIAFVCTRIICWKLRSSTQMYELDSSISDLQNAENRVGGLESILVAAIPTMRFNREAFSSVEDAQCSICLGEYQEKELLRIMPKCGHNFHLSCIDVWLQKQSTCPVCRLPVKDSLKPRHLRQATISMVQSLDSLETSSEWLMPGSQHLEGLAENQRHVSPIRGNAELASMHSQTAQ